MRYKTSWNVPRNIPDDQDEFECPDLHSESEINLDIAENFRDTVPKMKT